MTKKRKNTGRGRSRLNFYNEAGIDLGDAIVSEIRFEANNLHLTISGVSLEHVGQSVIRVQFQTVQEFESVFFELNDRLFAAFDRNSNKPKSGLYSLACSRSTKGQFPRIVDIAIAPMRKPSSFRCKRVVIALKDGTHVAGDTPLPEKTWTDKDYERITRRVAELVESGSYDEIHNLLSQPLRKKKTVKQVSAGIEKWKKVPRSFREVPQGDKAFAVTLYGSGSGGNIFMDENRGLDPDTICMTLQIEFLDRFLLELVLVEENGKLVVGRYKAHREW